MGIASKIAEIAKEKGVSLKELSRLIDVPYTTLYHAIKRDSKIDFETLLKIANALNLPDPMIFYSEEEKESAWAEILQENSGMVTHFDGNGKPQTELVKKDNKGEIQRIYTTDLKTDVVKKIAIHMAIDHIWGRNSATSLALLNSILGLYPADGERTEALLKDIEKLAYNIQIKDPTQK